MEKSDKERRWEAIQDDAKKHGVAQTLAILENVLSLHIIVRDELRKNDYGLLADDRDEMIREQQELIQRLREKL